MMRLKFKLCLLFILPLVGYSQIDCSKLSSRSFEIKTNSSDFLRQSQARVQIRGSGVFK